MFRYIIRNIEQGADDASEPVSASQDGDAFQRQTSHLERGGKRALITNPVNMLRALSGQTGAHFLV